MLIDVAIDFTLPFALAYAEPYVGVAAASFLAGVVKGRNSDFTPSSWSETAGMTVGTVWGLRKNIAKKFLTNSTDIVVETIKKEAIETIANTAVTNGSKQVCHATTHQGSQKIEQVAGKYLDNLNVRKQIWSATKKKNSVENAFNHWKNHRKEFPEILNSKQYVERTWDFIKKPPIGTLQKVRTNGDKMLYNPNSNIFVIANQKSIPRTMFKPDIKIHEYPSNLEYFHAQ